VSSRDPVDPPPPQVGPRGEPGLSPAQKNWATLFVGCLSGLGMVLGVVFLVGLALVGLVLFTCSIR
jgi:hypothetical protein